MVNLADDPIRSTWIFGAILVAAVFATTRRRASGGEAFPKSVTEDLKGLAILLVVFAHIGYALVPGGRFLFPISVGGGVGVNIFLILAGYGLTASAIAKPRAPLDFYRRHLPKLYAPMWATLAIFLAADWLMGVGRGAGEIASAAIGYFPTADLYADINSPLWYFTFIVGCYLLFPLTFSAKRPWLSAAIYAGLGYALAAWRPSALGGVIGLYADHHLAFPVGILAAWVLASRDDVARALVRLRDSLAGGWVAAALLAAASWCAVRAAGIGTSWEQGAGIAMALAAILALALAPVRFRLLGTFGLLSYEIYLLHWPILSRWPSLYGTLPGWLATTAYLAVLLGLGALLKKSLGRKWKRPGA